jgi:hypothetical protein
MVDTEKKTETPKADSLSLQRRKEEISRRNDKVMTESKKQRLKDAKLVK